MNSIGTLNFEGQPIKVSTTHTQDIDKVCINDVCAALKRQSFLDDGTVVHRCKELIILDEAHPQDLYAGFNESVGFIQWMCDESKILALTGRRLLQFLQQARFASAIEPNALPAAEEIIRMEYSGNKFTMRTVDGRYMVNATEMSRPFEKRPAVWLKTTETVRLRQELVDNGISPSLESQVITTRGSQGATWLEVHLWVQFAQWLSPAFASWCSRKILTFLKGGQAPIQEDDAGESYHESYQRDDESADEKQPTLPENYETALALIASQKSTIHRQDDFIRLNKHKCEHYDETIESRTWFSTTMLAHELNITAIQLNLFLMEQNIQRKIEGVWAVNREYGHLRNVHYYEWYNHRTRYINKYKMEGWTHQGREYILELWKKING